MARSVRIDWSEAALADLDRFAEFLHRKHPALAGMVAHEIIEKSRILSEYPKLGRPIAGRAEYRQLALQVLNGTYVFQYRFDGEHLTMLRVFHGREDRE